MSALQWCKRFSVRLLFLSVVSVVYLVLFAHSTILAATVDLSVVVGDDGAITATATGFSSSCQATNNSVSIQLAINGNAACWSANLGSTSCTYRIDRSAYPGTTVFVGTAIDCSGNVQKTETITLDNSPTITITAPEAVTKSPFNVTGIATFTPTLSASKGWVGGDINNSSIGNKECMMLDCSYNYQAMTGSLLNYPPGTYTLLLAANNYRQIARTVKSFTVVSTPESNKTGSNCGVLSESTLNPTSGNLYHDQAIGVLLFSYNSADIVGYTTPLGTGWTHNYNMSLTAVGSILTLRKGDGGYTYFSLSNGTYIPEPKSGDTILTPAVNSRPQSTQAAKSSL